MKFCKGPLGHIMALYGLISPFLAVIDTNSFGFVFLNARKPWRKSNKTKLILIYKL